MKFKVVMHFDIFNGADGHWAGHANRARLYFFNAIFSCRKRAKSALGGPNRIENDRMTWENTEKNSIFPISHIIILSPAPFTFY